MFLMLPINAKYGDVTAKCFLCLCVFDSLARQPSARGDYRFLSQ